MKTVSPFLLLIAGCTASLWSQDGTGTGLQGAYFLNETCSGTPALTRLDPTVGFSWGTGSPAAAITPNNFSVRWHGEIQPRYSEP